MSSHDPLEGKWVLVESTPARRVYELDMGDGQVVVKTEYLADQELFDLNAARRAENAGRKWGDGAVAGSVPMNLYFASGLAEANRQGDKAFIKRWWNDADHARFRTKEGKV